MDPREARIRQELEELKQEIEFVKSCCDKNRFRSGHNKLTRRYWELLVIRQELHQWLKMLREGDLDSGRVK